MTRFLNLILLISISFCSYGQNEAQLSDYIKMTETDSLYLIAIQKYTAEIKTFFRKNPERKKPKIIYIQNENYLRLITNQINGFEIQKIGIANRKKVFRENKNKLELVKVSPLTIENGQFKIGLIPYLAELKSKKRLNLSLSVWTNVYFNYVDGKLIYAETKNGGI